VTIAGMAGPGRPGWGALLGAEEGIQPAPKPPPTLWWDEKDGKQVESLFAERFRKADRFTERFTLLAGFEQDWCMFGPPMAKSADFLAVRLEFTDGSEEVMYSDNEPRDWKCYFRVGDWQDRKLENQIMRAPSHGVLERRLHEAYVRHAVKKWQRRRPGDPREVMRVVLLRHTLYFLNRVKDPNQQPKDVDKRNKEEPLFEVAAFDARGNLLQ
jgi:hypothetical protein